jgi:hypothetical protein
MAFWPSSVGYKFLIGIKVAVALISDPCISKIKRCAMGLGEVLFLVLVVAAAGAFTVTLAYYSRR